MLSSAEDAIAFFRRWEEHEVRLSVTVEVGEKEVIISASAWISFSEDGLLLKAVDLVNYAEGHYFALQVPLADITNYEYRTTRELFTLGDSEAPDDDNVQNIWELLTKSGVTISLWE